MPLDLFTPATRSWFEATFPRPTDAQAEGWPAIAGGEHTLIHAPTGSGKTLAAFLWTLDRLLNEPEPEDSKRCRVLYVSPLKALAYDIERNLRAPLAGIRHAADGDLPEVRVSLRTGDTPANERQPMLRKPPDILITTPESLYLMLTSRARDILRTVRWVIVDEVHAVAASKRGAHLALSLERLEEVALVPPQRIGLSATQRPLEVVGSFLAGGTVEAEAWMPRPVNLVDVPGTKKVELEVVVTTEDMEHPAVSDDSTERSIWPSIYPTLLDEIRRHGSTIVFANSRRLAERISAELNALAGEQVSRAHHGSVAREQRLEIEELLKRGELPAVVATSSLELGIDMGAVDMVLQVEAPISVASGLQRVGRAGHRVGVPSRAKLFPKYRGDLLATTVVSQLMVRRQIEATRIPRSPLDVLAQHIVAACAIGDQDVDELFQLVRRAAPFAELARGPYEAVLDMLAGRYPSELFSELQPRIVWDRVAGRLSGRRGAQQLAVQNPGTIPDRGLYSVHLPDGPKVGELDEEMVYESRVGDVFVLGSSTWRISEIGPDRVEVLPAPGEPAARMPFWHGDMLGRHLDTGKALGRFTRELGALEPEAAKEKLVERYNLNPYAATNLVSYLAAERRATGTLPTDRELIVERFRDEIGDWRVVILSPLGARVHAPWAIAVAGRLRHRFGHDVNAIWGDDGMAFRLPDTADPPDTDVFVPEPDEVEELLVDELADTALFAARFREAAARALLLPRRRPGKRTPLWLQRRRAADLLAVARNFGSFPIILETYREILQDDFDLPALQEVLTDIRSRRLRVSDIETETASPFAASLLFQFVASFLYEGDAPLAERRAAALTLDRGLLRELMGEAELRELISERVIEEVELELQSLTPGRKARSADELHDLLQRLGPLTHKDAEARMVPGTEPHMLEELEEARRSIRVMVGGETRWAAVEDAARLRDALGVQPPAGTPAAFLEPVSDPMGDIVGRYARTHGPFLVYEAAGALALPPAAVAETLSRLEGEGRVTSGSFRPGGASTEWVAVTVLRRLKRRALAELREEIEPVEPTVLSRFLPAWQGVRVEGRGRSNLEDALRQIQGIAIPASVLERDVLPARVRYRPEELDQLTTRGEMMWVGQGPLGTRDGRIALVFSENKHLLAPTEIEEPEAKTHRDLLDHLEKMGASFFRDLYEAAGGGDPAETVEALWDLVWSGRVTNDSFLPLRARLKGRRLSSKRRQPNLAPPDATGRWSLVPRAGDPTRHLTAITEQLLDSQGVVTRAGVGAAGVPGGFAGIYPVLSAMEDVGRVRRGYFVEGLGGAQFALPGAIDRLRSKVSPPGLLAATDPANPYGNVLPWPEREIARPARIAGAYVFLGVNGLEMFAGGKSIWTFADGDVTLWAEALADAASRYRTFAIERVDGVAVLDSPLGGRLLESGFVRSPRGVTHRRRG